MDTKAELIDCVKKWLKIDSELKELKDDIKKLNNEKKSITDNLTSVMKTNEIECLNTKEGSLLFKQIKTKKALNAKSLSCILDRFYSDDNLMAETVKLFILDNREEQVKETIKLKKDK
jgi:predicted phage-related endonuclease